MFIANFATYMYHFIIHLMDLIWNGFLGAYDAIKPWYTLSLYYRSTTMKKLINPLIYWNCFVLMSNMLIYYIVNNSTLYALVWILWVGPIWIVSDTVNRYYQDEIMRTLCQSKSSKKKSNIVNDASTSSPSVPPSPITVNTPKKQERTLANKITDIVYENLFFLCMHVLITLSNSMWSKTLYCIGYSLTCSYSLMSYRLNYNSLTFSQKLKMFEKYWVYFLFFGLPFTMLYVFLPSPLSYPCYYILAGIALPNTVNVVPRKSIKWMLPFRIFYIPEFLVHQVSHIMKSLFPFMSIADKKQLNGMTTEKSTFSESKIF
jgi:hypothetical protein